MQITAVLKLLMGTDLLLQPQHLSAQSASRDHIPAELVAFKDMNLSIPLPALYYITGEICLSAVGL